MNVSFCTSSLGDCVSEQTLSCRFVCVTVRIILCRQGFPSSADLFSDWFGHCVVFCPSHDVGSIPHLLRDSSFPMSNDCLKFRVGCTEANLVIGGAVLLRVRRDKETKCAELVDGPVAISWWWPLRLGEVGAMRV